MAKVIDDIDMGFLGSYPEKKEGLDSLSSIIIIGGLTSVDYATKESFKDIFKKSLDDGKIQNIYENTILVIGNMGLDLGHAIKYSEKLSSKSGISINDTKIVCFSGGSQTLFSQINRYQGKFSYIGLIDPSTAPGINAIAGYGQQINMVYNPDNWKGSNAKLGEQLDSWSKKILQSGGKSQLVSGTGGTHSALRSYFFTNFWRDLIYKIPKGTQQTASSIATQTTGQATNGLPSSTTPLKLSDGYRQALTFFRRDEFGKTIDLKTSTVAGAIKLLSEELLYTKNMLMGVKDLAGQVYRIKEILDSESDDIYYDNFIAENSGVVRKRYIVGIFGLDDYLPIPGTFDTTEQDKIIISMYKQFDIEDGINASVGDIVIVNFNNYQMYNGGKIIANLNPNANQQATSPVGGSVVGFIKDMMSKLSDSVLQILDSSETRQFMAYDVTTGKPTGQISVKTIQGKYLREDMAAAFLKMSEDAKKAGIILKINDGFRTYEQQEIIYNERYTNGKINEIGKKKGPAAQPGFSKHQNGSAIDIDVGGFDTNIYFWLAQNAPKYGFINTGNSFNKREPWHWEFNSSKFNPTNQMDH